MTDGSEDDVGGVALATLEVAAAEVPIVLHVANDGFDGRAAAQFALDDAEDAALLTGDEDAVRVGRVVAAIALVDIGALDRTRRALSLRARHRLQLRRGQDLHAGREQTTSCRSLHRALPA